MIVRVDVERTEYGHIFLEVDDYDEAEQIVNDRDFDSYDIVLEDANWNEGWVGNTIAIIEEGDENHD